MWQTDGRTDRQDRQTDWNKTRQIWGIWNLQTAYKPYSNWIQIISPCDLKVNSNWSYSPEILNLGKNWQIFVLCDLEIWWMTLKNNRTPFLFYIEFCPSFQIHQLIQTWVTVRKYSIRVKTGIYLSHVTLKFDRWPWKITRHLFYAASRFEYHFIAIIRLKLELQFGNAQFGSKLTIF